MSPLPASSADALSPFEQLRFAQEVLRTEAQAVLALATRLDGDFCVAADMVFACQGCVFVSGMGKAGHVARKLSATFASTGTRSHFLHPSEAIHGDLGRLDHRDVLLVLSHSGETEEITRLLPMVREMGAPIIAMTGRPASTLASSAAIALDLGPLREACELGLAPSTSTTAMLALGDALALVVSRMRRFTAADFARYHPGGNLGRKLARVDDHMRPLAECRVAAASCSVREVYIGQSRPGRRSGAIMLTDESGRLAGIFTDTDLARLLENRREGAIDGPIASVMTRSPQTVQSGEPMSAAVTILADRKLSELPVVDAAGQPAGLIDITDVVGLLPRSPDTAPPADSAVPLAHSAMSVGQVEAGAAAYRSSTIPFRTKS